jgi:hypothetical protein
MKITRTEEGFFLVEEEGKKPLLFTMNDLFTYLTNMFREEVREIEIKIRKE